MVEVKDTDNLHIHLIANRISIGGNVYNTDFISNRASNLAEKISKKMGLTIANHVYKEKEFQKPKISPERQAIKTQLQNIAYEELRRKHPTIESFLNSLEQQNVKIKFAKNKQGKTYGLRFGYEGQTFKASEIGKEFGLHSLYNHFGLRLNGQSANAKHLAPKPEPQPQEQTTISQNQDSGIASVFSVLSTNSNYDATEAELAEQAKLKKKKKKGMRRGW